MSKTNKIKISNGMIKIGDIVHVRCYSSGWDNKKVKITSWSIGTPPLITTEAVENFPGYNIGKTLFFRSYQLQLIQTTLENHLMKLVEFD